MAPKRKSEILDDSSEDMSAAPVVLDPPAKKTRPTKKTENAEPPAKKARISKNKGESSAAEEPIKTWKDIILPGEDSESGNLPVYDDCNEIRRKIRVLQKTPGWKITHWLKEIGNVNSNSYNRFMSLKGKDGGAGNNTYYCAYVYFEKVRVLEGKKKTPTRIANESQFPDGFPLQNAPKYLWVRP